MSVALQVFHVQPLADGGRPRDVLDQHRDSLVVRAHGEHAGGAGPAGHSGDISGLPAGSQVTNPGVAVAEKDLVGGGADRRREHRRHACGASLRRGRRNGRLGGDLPVVVDQLERSCGHQQAVFAQRPSWRLAWGGSGRRASRARLQCVKRRSFPAFRRVRVVAADTGAMSLGQRVLAACWRTARIKR